MSSEDTSCASCGIAEVDYIIMKECAACDLVKYCSDECQKDHEAQHEEECKKRAAELRDELLFKQPENRFFGDCPICMIPLPLDHAKSFLHHCCSKLICKGCMYANYLREEEASLKASCPFCRKPVPKTDEEANKLIMKRIEANDPVALNQQGKVQRTRGEYFKSVEYFTKAAELGDADAHSQLARLYICGEGVEEDNGKGMYHLEEAAIGGLPNARHVLGVNEYENGNTERAVKHWIISATQGFDESIKRLMDAFKGGFVEKEALTAVFRAHQAAVDATKSPQREAAKEIERRLPVF